MALHIPVIAAYAWGVTDGPEAAELDDAGLARCVAAAGPGGAAAAEAALYHRLAPRVRLYGRRHLRDDQAAADLAQQVLLKTIEALRTGKLREPERLVSFIFGMCRRVVLDLRRMHARRERLLDAYAADVPVADPAGAPQLDRARLRECLERLPERERTVLVLSFFEEQPAQAVADALGLSEGNVRVIRHRGLQRLRACVTGAKGDT